MSFRCATKTLMSCPQMFIFHRARISCKHTMHEHRTDVTQGSVKDVWILISLLILSVFTSYEQKHANSISPCLF